MERKFAAVIFLAAALAVVLWYQRDRSTEGRVLGGSDAIPKLTAFADAPPSRFERFEVLRENYEPVTLVRDAASGRWRLSTRRGFRELDPAFEWRLLYPSRNATVPDFKADVPAVYVGSNQERNAEYGLTDMAPRVRFLDSTGKVLEDLIIGMRQGPDGVSSFVRKKGSNDVFSIPIPIHDNFIPRDHFEWRRKIAVDRISPADVATIIVEHSDTNRSFRIATDGVDRWKISSPALSEDGVARHTKVLRLIANLNRATASSFPGDADDLWGDAPIFLSIRVEKKDGTTAGPIEIGPAAEGENLARLCRTPLLQDTFLLEKAAELVDRPEAFLLP